MSRLSKTVAKLNKAFGLPGAVTVYSDGSVGYNHINDGYPSKTSILAESVKEFLEKAKIRILEKQND